MERKFSEIFVLNFSNKTKINTISSLEVVQETNIHKFVSNLELETSLEHFKYKRMKRQNTGTSQTVASRTFFTMFV